VKHWTNRVLIEWVPRRKSECKEASGPESLYKEPTPRDTMASSGLGKGLGRAMLTAEKWSQNLQDLQ
jgi:hypothetical protein